MRFQSDPIRRYRRAVLYLWLASVPALVATAIWAWRPTGPITPPSTLLTFESAAPSPIVAETTLDRTAFATSLWREPPSPPAPEPSERPRRAAPAPPPKFDLLGIVRDGDSYFAAVYDPEQDRILLLGNGDRVGTHRVVKVNAVFLEMTDGQNVHRVSLWEGQS